MESTNAPGEPEQSVGERLFAAGWRQGAIFQAADVQFAVTEINVAGSSGRALHTRNVRAKEWLILISQECDIAHEEDSTEPYIEAMICNMGDSKHAARIERNSAREFVIDPQTSLIAQARYRLAIAKKALVGLTPKPWPSDTERFERFVRWLARRYDRPALPNAMDKVFQKPVEHALEQLDQTAPEVGVAFSRAVHELRVNVPRNEEPPFELQLTFLIKTDTLTNAEFDALFLADAAIRERIDPNEVSLGEPIIVTLEEITMADYFATRPLFLEFHTYRGDEIEGAKPYPRA